VRKIKEVLRLKFALGLGLRQIARSCSIGLGTVHEYLQRAEAAGVTWPLGGDWDEDRLEAALFGGPPPQIGDPTVADGILDGLVHNAHRIEMRGDSMRKNRGKSNT
jgi:hypothetical protein